MAEVTKRYAVVTGANKGIGLEICKQLAQKGIIVVLTSRDEKRGLESHQSLKDSGLSDHLLFHQLDVADPESITSLANFVKKHFGKLDILVNNDGILGATFSIPPGCEPNGGDRLEEISTGLTTEEKLSEIISEYLRDFKEGTHGSNGWPTFLSVYTVSKVALNAYTRILANKYPDFCINCVCPGYAKTDINYNAGTITTEEGAKTPIMLALLPKGLYH
ncbi:hypothetical protein V6N13_008176 [Hibiscus sabdariffa]|uniref:(+)-neomenthol dehydrogenase-like n=1 Tax=Hibiscus sabdariffa TaxID=183260 RepID=A0ABR2ECU8_9ROSI